MSFGKEIANFFFTKGVDVQDGNKVKSTFTCNSVHLAGRECTTKGVFRVVIANGYTNLRSHLINCIPNYQDIVDARDVVIIGPDIRQFVKVDKKTYNIFKWIDWVIEDNLAFSFCEKKRTRENTCGDPISRTTLMKYMDSLAWEVQLELTNILPDKFGLVFDGWDDHQTNYFGVFVIWWDEKRVANRVYLLRLYPLVRCDDYGADSHKE
jgi:hypothetical protein